MAKDYKEIAPGVYQGTDGKKYVFDPMRLIFGLALLAGLGMIIWGLFIR